MLKVSPNHFPIANIQVTIRDPQKRWKELVLDFDPGKNSYVVKWDRRFADGTLAPAGEYPVLAVACDVNGLCGQDTGRIVIPEVATSTATLTPIFPPTLADHWVAGIVHGDRLCQSGGFSSQSIGTVG